MDQFWNGPVVRTLVAIIEDPRFIPHTQMAAQTGFNSDCRKSNALFWLRGIQAFM